MISGFILYIFYITSLLPVVLVSESLRSSQNRDHNPYTSTLNRVSKTFQRRSQSVGPLWHRVTPVEHFTGSPGEDHHSLRKHYS